MGRKIRTLFSGEGFNDWSESMKKQLISEGLWSSIEEVVKMAETAEETKHQVMNDLKAQIIIKKSLSPHIFMSVVHAKTAKQAWDTLHNTFMVSSKEKFVSQPSHGSVRRSKMKKLSPNESTDDDDTSYHTFVMPKTKKNKSLQGSLNDAASTDPMIEPSHGSARRSKMKEVSVNESTDDDDSSDTLPDVGDDDEIKPFSGDKPFFNIALTKFALKPNCQLVFPSRFNSLLPSNNVQALVRFFGQDYDIKFNGSRRQKSLGSGWRQLVEDHKLKLGDLLVFEIMKCDEDKLEISLQLLKNTLPPDLEEEIKKRKLAASKRKAIIDIPDSSASDEDE